MEAAAKHSQPEIEQIGIQNKRSSLQNRVSVYFASTTVAPDQAHHSPIISNHHKLHFLPSPQAISQNSFPSLTNSIKNPQPTQPRIVLPHQPRPLLQPINTRKIQTILIQILQQIRSKQNRYHAAIDLPQHPFRLDRIERFVARRFVQAVIVVDMVRGRGDVVWGGGGLRGRVWFGGARGWQGWVCERGRGGSLEVDHVVCYAALCCAVLFVTAVRYANKLSAPTI